MVGFESLINILEKEKTQAHECKCLNTAKKDNNYHSYLDGKEEAFNLCILLLQEFKKLNEN